MSDLLYRLGQRALGTLPRVEPLMRPGHNQAGIASQARDPFDESETFREADASPAQRELQDPSPESREARPARPVAAPTLDKVIAQIFRDEPEAARSAHGTEPTQNASSSAHRSTHAGPAPASPSTHHNPLEEAAAAPSPRGAPRVYPDASTRTERTPSRMPEALLTLSSMPTDSARQSISRTDVEVSIGRIEVHTAPAAAPPAPALSRKVPVLSLDEYLARRRGERA